MNELNIQTISSNDFCNYLQNLTDFQNITSITLNFYGGSVSIKSLKLADGISPVDFANDKLDYITAINTYNELITKQNSTVIPFLDVDVRDLVDNKNFSKQSLIVETKSDDFDYIYDRTYFVYYNNYEAIVAIYYLSVNTGKFLVTGFNDKSEKLFRIRLRTIYTDFDDLYDDLQKCFPDKQITFTQTNSTNFKYNIKQKSLNLSKHDSYNNDLQQRTDLFIKYNITAVDLYDYLEGLCDEFNYFAKHDIKSNNADVVDADFNTFIINHAENYNFETPMSIATEYYIYLKSSSYIDGYKVDDNDEGQNIILKNVPLWKAVILMYNALQNNDWPDDNPNTVTNDDLFNFIVFVYY